MADLKKEKEELIEMFGIHFEKHFYLPPLGARILGNLILDCCGKGLTFDDLVERMGASKSSISTNLNLLLKMEKVHYYTIPGDRKKYYKPTPFSSRFTNYLKIIAFEKQIIDRMVCYREKTISCPEELANLEHGRVYKQHLTETEQMLQKTIENFKRIENK